MRYACTAFYAHPWAWNEIGFGGPAYPRGYKHLALGGREPWEVAEHDADDPVPWAERADAAKTRHAAGLSSTEASRQGPDGTNEPFRMNGVRTTQRVGLAAAERRLADEPPATSRHAPLRARRRGRHCHRRVRRRRRRPGAATGPAGWRVVVLDAGPFWDPDKDWVSDEAGSHQLYWNEPRVISGSHPVELGSNNSGRGVGGSMVHFAGYAPRFHPSDFRTLTDDGVGADWPIEYARLKRVLRAHGGRTARGRPELALG